MAEAIARLINYPTSPRKMRYVADTIRGRDVNYALDILQHQAKQGAKPMYKLLLSAIDNWSKKEEGNAAGQKRSALRIEDAQLFVKIVYVDGGTVLKRWLNAPHGRAFKMRKRSNHITIIVDSKVLMAEKPKRETELADDTQVEEPIVDVAAETQEESAEKKPAKKAAKKKSKKEKEVAAQ